MYYGYKYTTNTVNLMLLANTKEKEVGLAVGTQE